MGTKGAYAVNHREETGDDALKVLILNTPWFKTQIGADDFENRLKILLVGHA
jgi:hypothetical protein